MNKHIFIGFICCVGLPLSAFSQEAVERPDVKPGSSWAFVTSDYYTKLSRGESQVTVTEVDDDSIRATLKSARSSSNVVYSRDWLIKQSGSRKIEVPEQRFQFPMRVGQTWKYSLPFVHRTCGPTSQAYTARVTGWENISVPAGKYRALRIDHDGTWSSSCGSGRIAKKFWYVPELKYYAKFESLDYGPDGQVADASVTELQSTRVD